MFIPASVMFIMIVSSILQFAPQSVDLAKLTVDESKVHSVNSLIRTSDMIIQGRPTGNPLAKDTGKKIQNKKIINFLQSIHVVSTLKGVHKSSINLLRPGISPLPSANDPLNETYPGALAAQDYILFLKKISGTRYYQVVGTWQGVYPLAPDGKVISLQEGFAELNGMNAASVQKLINRTEGYSTKERKRAYVGCQSAHGGIVDHTKKTGA